MSRVRLEIRRSFLQQEELLEETAEDDEPITEEETGKMLKSAVKELEVALKVTAVAIGVKMAVLKVHISIP